MERPLLRTHSAGGSPAPVASSCAIASSSSRADANAQLLAGDEVFEAPGQRVRTARRLRSFSTYETPARVLGFGLSARVGAHDGFLGRTAMRGTPRSIPRWSARPTTRTRLRALEIVGALARVRSPIELDAEPAERAADAFAQDRAVLADAGGERQHVEPAEHGRRARRSRARCDARRARARLARADPVLDRRAAPAGSPTGRRRRAGPDSWYSRRASRSALDPLGLHQVQQHAGIDRAAARAHHQPVERGKAHGRGDAREPCIAHRLAPLPRCATIVRPRAASPCRSASATAMYSYDRP